MRPAYSVYLFGVLQEGAGGCDHQARTYRKNLDAAQREARRKINDEALRKDKIEDLLKIGGYTGGPV